MGVPTVTHIQFLALIAVLLVMVEAVMPGSG